jgi:hypothetical protein
MSSASVINPASPNGTDVPNCLPDLAGEYYINVLARLHQALRPTTYLEIGTFQGASLEAARCATISIDPAFQLASAAPVQNKPFCGLYQQTSDEFFATNNPSAILGGPLDLAFLDGMHWCEFLLRDFFNTERFCRPDSVIALHDCLPVEAPMAERNGGLAITPHRQGWWTGDVWRTLWALRQYRPDLDITVLDAGPTGLVLITGLDPASTLLAEREAEIVAAMMAQSLEAIGLPAWHAAQQVQSATAFGTETMAARFLRG